MPRPPRFGRFWLHEKIGRGGMADVYRASLGDDPNHNSFDFALKCMHAHLKDDAHHVEMFLIEEYVQRLLHHPNIVRMYESGRVDDIPYIAMEYIAGADLETLLAVLAQRRLRVPIDLALDVTIQLLKAVDYVHRATAPGGKPMEMIHRDISPANIYLSFKGDVKLGDFGVARVDILERTDRRWIKGKVAYLPPEVLVGGDVTQQWDLWSVAVVLYEMLTGRRLFGALSEAEIVACARAGRFPALELGPEIDKSLRDILERALHQRPAKRPQDASSFYRELKAYTTSASMLPTGETLARFVLATTGNIEHMSGQGEGSLRDWLTGAVSERYMLEMLQIELDRAQRYGRVFSLVVMDLDEFKQVNDTLGPALGDDLLCALAKRFFSEIAGLRSCDWVARRHGDHFCIVLPETSHHGAMIAAERIRRCLETMSWTQLDPRLDVRLTASLGVASYPEHGKSLAALFEAADGAHYEAKQRRNTVLAARVTRPGTQVISAGVATVDESTGWQVLQIDDDHEREHRRRMRTPPVEITFRREEDWLRAYASDIRGGGLRIRVPGNFRTGSQIHLRLRLPDDPGEHVVLARVFWTGNDEMVGFQFLSVPHELERRIETILWRQLNPASLG